MTDSTSRGTGRLYEVPPAPPGDGEGNSPAAWTMYLIMLAGLVVAGLGMVIAVHMLIWVGAAVVVLGVIAGGVLRAAGYGLAGRRVRS